MIQAPSASSITMPPGGWNDFVESVWEQKPAYFPNCCSTPFLTPDRLLPILLKAGQNELSGSRQHLAAKAGLRFYIEQARSSSDLSGYLPRSEDKSITEYSDRLSQMVGDRDFTLLIDHAQAHDFELWRTMRSFVSGLVDRIGVPLRNEILIYVSKAQKTAIGMHQDPYSNFLFQLRGKKRFYLWPAEVFRSRPELMRTSRLAEVRDQATVVDSKPGDLLYIPSDYYHFAEASGDLSIHLSIIISIDQNIASHQAMRLISGIVRHRMDAVSAKPFLKLEKSSPNSLELNLPTAWTAIIDECSDLKYAFTQSMIGELLRVSTSFGCEVSPHLETPGCELTDDDAIELDTDSTIAYHVFEGTLYLASNGHGFSCPAHSSVLALVDCLTKAQAHRVSWFLETYCGRGAIGDVKSEINRDHIKVLLDRLYKIRAIRVVPEFDHGRHAP